MTTSRVFFVCGARRTGTTLLAAVLSADKSAPPLAGEAQLLPEWLATYRWARQQFAMRALPFFDDEDELRVFYRRTSASSSPIAGTGLRRDAALILKCPELSLDLRGSPRDLPGCAIPCDNPRPPGPDRIRVASHRETAGPRGGPQDPSRARLRCAGTPVRPLLRAESSRPSIVPLTDSTSRSSSSS